MSEEKKYNVGCLLIATNKYKTFVPQLLEGIKKYFLPDHNIKVFLFNDEFKHYDGNERVKIEQHPIPSYRFPEASLFRYKIFRNHHWQLSKMDYLFYLDVDMSIVAEVGNEILVDDGLMSVNHPGFFVSNGWGDNFNPIESKSYLPKEKRKKYQCGGNQGGVASDYLTASQIMADAIDEDEKNGVRAEWSDETFWNWYTHTSGVKITEFTPSFCMPEPMRLREAWGLTELKPIILALDKNHNEIRQ